MRRREETVNPSQRRGDEARRRRCTGVPARPWFHAFLLVSLLAPAALCSAQPGPLVAWGMPGSGRATPGDEYMALCAGGYHFLALTANGTLTAWGENMNGQCNVPSGGGFVAIAAGRYHNLALKSDGSIVAWGDNSRGQCSIPRDGRFFAIAAGDWHSLAIRTDGSLVAWGWNDHGQCAVPAGRGYIEVAAGLHHSIALKADQSIVAWGDNSDGQCDAPRGPDFLRIAAGTLHNLALRSNGSLVAWGRDDEGQCKAPAGYNFVSIAAGSFHSLALRSDGTLLAWGRNDYAQCDVPADTSFAEVAAAGFHTVAIRETRTEAQRLSARVSALAPDAEVASATRDRSPKPTVEAPRPDRSVRSEQAAAPASVTPPAVVSRPGSAPEPNQASPSYAKPPVVGPTDMDRKAAGESRAEPNSAAVAKTSRKPAEPNRAASAPAEQTKTPATLPVDPNGRPLNPADPVVQGFDPDLYMDAADNAAPVYHFTSVTSTRHFCTISEKEKYDLIDNHSDIWRYEGIAFYAYPEGRQPPGARPVYRFWSATVGRHLYTMDEGQKQMLIDLFPQVWKYEGVAWYAPPAKPQKK